MTNNTIISFFKNQLSSFALAGVVALTILATITSCGDAENLGNTDISNYNLNYDNIVVLRDIESPIDIAPNWGIPPTQVTYSITPDIPMVRN